MERFIAVWGFVIAGALFMLAALIPALTGEGLNTTFFVLGIAFLIIGGIMVRRPPADSAPNDSDSPSS